MRFLLMTWIFGWIFTLGVTFHGGGFKPLEAIFAGTGLFFVWPYIWVVAIKKVMHDENRRTQ